MLLSLRNIRQQQESDCLAACASMVLEYLGIQINYRRLLRTLNVGTPGAPFPNIERLRSFGVVVTSGQYGNLNLIEQSIEIGLPVITAVRTWALAHWDPVDTEHAVVIVGFDDEFIYINDPFFEESPIPMKIDHFLGAWVERDEQYAILSLTKLELAGNQK